MSGWTHAICYPCWEQRYPGKTPHRLIPPALDKEVCCFCGAETESGIFVRHDPQELKCKGACA